MTMLWLLASVCYWLQTVTAQAPMTTFGSTTGAKVIPRDIRIVKSYINGQTVQNGSITLDVYNPGQLDTPIEVELQVPGGGTVVVDVKVSPTSYVQTFFPIQLLWEMTQPQTITNANGQGTFSTGLPAVADSATKSFEVTPSTAAGAEAGFGILAGGPPSTRRRLLSLQEMDQADPQRYASQQEYVAQGMQVYHKASETRATHRRLLSTTTSDSLVPTLTPNTDSNSQSNVARQACIAAIQTYRSVNSGPWTDAQIQDHVNTFSETQLDSFTDLGGNAYANVVPTNQCVYTAPANISGTLELAPVEGMACVPKCRPGVTCDLNTISGMSQSEFASSGAFNQLQGVQYHDANGNLQTSTTWFESVTDCPCSPRNRTFYRTCPLNPWVFPDVGGITQKCIKGVSFGFMCAPCTMDALYRQLSPTITNGQSCPSQFVEVMSNPKCASVAVSTVAVGCVLGAGAIGCAAGIALDAAGSADGEWASLGCQCTSWSATVTDTNARALEVAQLSAAVSDETFTVQKMMNSANQFASVQGQLQNDEQLLLNEENNLTTTRAIERTAMMQMMSGINYLVGLENTAAASLINAAAAQDSLIQTDFSQNNQVLNQINQQLSTLIQGNQQMLAMARKLITIQQQAANLEAQQATVVMRLVEGTIQKLTGLFQAVDLLTSGWPVASQVWKTFYRQLMITRYIQGWFPAISDFEPRPFANLSSLLASISIPGGANNGSNSNLLNDVQGVYGIPPALTLDPDERSIALDLDYTYYITPNRFFNQTVYSLKHNGTAYNPFNDTLEPLRIHQVVRSIECSSWYIMGLTTYTAPLTSISSLIGAPGCDINTGSVANQRCACIVHTTHSSCLAAQHNSTILAAQMVQLIHAKKYPATVTMGRNTHATPLTQFLCAPSTTVYVHSNTTFYDFQSLANDLSNVCMGRGNAVGSSDTAAATGTANLTLAQQQAARQADLSLYQVRARPASVNPTFQAFLSVSVGNQGQMVTNGFDPTACSSDPLQEMYYSLNTTGISLTATLYNWWMQSLLARVSSAYLEELRFKVRGREPRMGHVKKFAPFGPPVSAPPSTPGATAVIPPLDPDTQAQLQLQQQERVAYLSKKLNITQAQAANATFVLQKLGISATTQQNLQATVFEQVYDVVDTLFIAHNNRSIPLFATQVNETRRDVFVSLRLANITGHANANASTLNVIAQQLNLGIYNSDYTGSQVTETNNYADMLTELNFWLGHRSCLIGDINNDTPPCVVPGSHVKSLFQQQGNKFISEYYFYDYGNKDLVQGITPNSFAGAANYAHLQLLVGAFNQTDLEQLNLDDPCGWYMGQVQTVLKRFATNNSCPALAPSALQHILMKQFHAYDFPSVWGAPLTNISTLYEACAVFLYSRMQQCYIPPLSIESIYAQNGFDERMPQSSSSGFNPTENAVSAESFRVSVTRIRTQRFDPVAGKLRPHLQFVANVPASRKNSLASVFDHFTIAIDPELYEGETDPDKWRWLMWQPIEETLTVTIALPTFETIRFAKIASPCPFDIQAVAGRGDGETVLQFIPPALITNPASVANKNLPRNATFILNVVSARGAFELNCNNRNFTLSVQFTNSSDLLFEYVLSNCHPESLVVTRVNVTQTGAVGGTQSIECWSWTNTVPPPPQAGSGSDTSLEAAATFALNQTIDVYENMGVAMATQIGLDSYATMTTINGMLTDSIAAGVLNDLGLGLDLSVTINNVCINFTTTNEGNLTLSNYTFSGGANATNQIVTVCSPVLVGGPNVTVYNHTYNGTVPPGALPPPSNTPPSGSNPSSTSITSLLNDARIADDVSSVFARYESTLTSVNNTWFKTENLTDYLAQVMAQYREARAQLAKNSSVVQAQNVQKLINQVVNTVRGKLAAAEGAHVTVQLIFGQYNYTIQALQSFTFANMTPKMWDCLAAMGAHLQDPNAEARLQLILYYHSQDYLLHQQDTEYVASNPFSWGNPTGWRNGNDSVRTGVETAIWFVILLAATVAGILVACVVGTCSCCCGCWLRSQLYIRARGDFKRIPSSVTEGVPGTKSAASASTASSASAASSSSSSTTASGPAETAKAMHDALTTSAASKAKPMRSEQTYVFPAAHGSSLYARGQLDE